MSIQEKLAFIRNDLKGIDHETLVGFNDGIGTGSYGTASESVVEDSTDFPWNYFDVGAPTSFSIYRQSAADNGKILTIDYLDADFEEKQVTHTITNVSTQSISLPGVYRINKATLSANVSGVEVTIRAAMSGVTKDVYKIPTNQKTSRHGCFTVPKGKKYAILAVTNAGESADGTACAVRIRTHGAIKFTNFNGFEDVISADAEYNYTFGSTEAPIPIYCPEGTDIEMRGIKTYGGTGALATVLGTIHFARFHR